MGINRFQACRAQARSFSVFQSPGLPFGTQKLVPPVVVISEKSRPCHHVTAQDEKSEESEHAARKRRGWIWAPDDLRIEPRFES